MFASYRDRDRDRDRARLMLPKSIFSKPVGLGLGHGLGKKLYIPTQVQELV